MAKIVTRFADEEKDARRIPEFDRAYQPLATVVANSDRLFFRFIDCHFAHVDDGGAVGTGYEDRWLQGLHSHNNAQLGHFRCKRASNTGSLPSRATAPRAQARDHRESRIRVVDNQRRMTIEGRLIFGGEAQLIQR